MCNGCDFFPDNHLPDVNHRYCCKSMQIIASLALEIQEPARCVIGILVFELQTESVQLDRLEFAPLIFCTEVHSGFADASHRRSVFQEVTKKSISQENENREH